MKLIIAGSRSITDYNVTRQALIESGLWAQYGKTLEIVCGEADGPDKHGRDIALAAGLTIHSKPAPWDDIKAPGAVVRYRYVWKDGKKVKQAYNLLAGIWRNHEMGDMAGVALIVWDGESTGSLDMAEYMASLGKRSIVYPTRKISVDTMDKLEAKGVEILFPNTLTGS